MAHILIVDDEPTVLSFMRTLLEREGHEVTTAQGGVKGKDELARQNFDLMITDYMMEPVDGMELLHHVQEVCPQMPAVMISGYCTVQNAVEVLKSGAFDYLPKPVKIDDLKEIVRRALAYHDAMVRRPTQDVRLGPGGLVAESKAMQTVCDMVRRLIPTDMPALLVGEKGAGKERVARVIHEEGKRQGKPFEVISADQDATAVAERLNEPKGEGALYLPEVSSLPLPLQEALAKNLGHAGSVRVLAGSSVPLDPLVAEGEFSGALLQRLSVFTLELPPFAERPEDVLGLTHTFLRGRVEPGGQAVELDPDVEILFENYTWPGNGDELESVLEEALPRADGTRLATAALPESLTSAVDLVRVKERQRAQFADLKGQSLKSFLRSREKEYLSTVMEAVGDDKEAAVEKLQIDPGGLARHLSSDAD